MTAPDSCETPAAPATSLSRRRLLVTSGLGWMFDALDVGLLAFVLAALQVAWGLSRAEMGWLGAINSIGMAVGAAAFGQDPDAERLLARQRRSVPS